MSQPLSIELVPARFDLWGGGRIRGITPEAAVAFQDNCRALTNRNVRLVSLGCFVITVVIWPTDVLIFGWGSDILEHFSRFRVGMLALSFTIWALTYTSMGRRWPSALAALTITALALIGGLTLGPLLLDEGPGGDTPWLYTTYLMPFFTIAMILPFRQRLLLTFGLCVVCSLLFVLPAASSPVLRGYWGAPTVVLLFAATASVLTGHILYRVFRLNYFQGLLLAERAQSLMALDRLKSDFFANVSHELRTPLTLILASLRTLASPTAGTGDSARERKAIDTGLRNASRLLMLVNDILELSRLESGQAQLKPVAYDLVELCRVVADSLQQGPTLSVVAGEPVIGLVDGPRVKDVVYNLASNALKFVDPDDGRVLITVRRNGGHGVISVEDNGSGIDETDLPNIFNRFYRGEGEQHDLGTGIGLAFVKQVVQLHGGEVTVRSTVGEGAHFTVRLPLGEVAPDAVVQTAAEDGLGDFLRQTASQRRMRDPELGAASPAEGAPLVLVADDNADLRAYLRDLLSDTYRLELAADGLEALEKARALAPDLILADVSMPRMSGPELLEAVRREAALAAIPFVFLTASAAVGSQGGALEAGADDYLTKPFDERELRARVANLIALKQSREKLTRMVDQLTLVNARMAEQLRHKADDLGVLLGELDTIRDEERVRLAREVHDQLGELVTGMRLGVVIAQQRADSEATLTALAKLDDLLDQTLEAVDRTVRGLRPKNVEDLGLVGSLEWLLDQFERRSYVTTALHHSGEVELAPATAEHVFRVVQEALTNVSRHARASRVEVDLALENGTLRVAVRDDGVGMVDAEAESERRGVVGMRERAALVGGELRVESVVGQGTTVRLEVPV